MYKGKHDVVQKFAKNKGQIAILIDPEKVSINEKFNALIDKIEGAGIDFIFVGGSTVTALQQSSCIAAIKSRTKIPVVIFPGCPDQIDENADSILFLNLISGRNPEYLIANQIKAVPKLMHSKLEIIPTAYLLVDGGKETMVQKISQTKSLSNDNLELALHTALAGIMMGNTVVYLDAGSGAKNTVPENWIAEMRHHFEQPIIVGGGIRSTTQVNGFFDAGANIVVIGNHIESNPEFLDELARMNERVEL